MTNYLYDHIQQMARWWVILILFAMSLVCNACFELRSWAMRIEAVRAQERVNEKDLVIPDRRYWGYGPDDLGAFFRQIGPDGRKLYVKTQTTLDLAYPFIYCFFFATLLVSLYPWAWTRWIIFLPFITAVFDLAENSSNVYLASVFKDGQPANGFARAASAFTMTKWGVLLACLLAIAIGLIVKSYLWLKPSSGS